MVADKNGDGYIQLSGTDWLGAPYEGPEIIQENHYYPFGLNMGGAWHAPAEAGRVNKYQYNDKELNGDLGLGWYDYGARWYAPDAPRFLSVDPKADHPNQVDKSPYAYAWDNPVSLTDPDGNCPLCPWLDAVVDAAFVVYDVGVLIHEKVTTGSTSADNWGALGADAASIAVPMSVGAGMVVRTTMKAANKVDNAVDAGKGVGKAADAGKAAKQTDEVKATTPYKRPNNATTKEQRESVQGKPCVDCGQKADKMVADHKKELVKEHYETGTIDKTKMRDVNSVQPQCPTCSAKQGAEMSKYSKEQKKKLNNGN